MSAPYTDHSAMDDSNSSTTKNSAPSLSSADIASQMNSQPSNSPLLPTSRKDTEQEGEDKIIITSIPVTGGVSQPYKNLFHRFMPAIKKKVVLMPQSEYNKRFARDKAGNYVGTEPEREWTERELDESYGKYMSSLPTAPARLEPQLWGGGGPGAAMGYGVG